MSFVDDLIEREAEHDPSFAREFAAECERLDVAVALTKLREEEGLTQRQLAERVRKPQSTIARIENGTLNPSLKLLSDIAQGVGRHLEVSFAR